MAELARFTPDTPDEEIVEVVRIDGGAIIEDAIDVDLLDRLEAELRPWIDRTPGGMVLGRKPRSKHSNSALLVPAE